MIVKFNHGLHRFTKMEALGEQVPIENELDHLLARSMRLERVYPYVMHLPVQNILHSSRSVLNSKKYSNEDITNGQYMLGQANSLCLGALKILKSTVPKKNYHISSFAERSSDIFQECVVKSIRELQNVTDTNYNSTLDRFLSGFKGNNKFSFENAGNEVLESCYIRSDSSISPKSRFYADSLQFAGKGFAKYLYEQITSDDTFNAIAKIPLSDIFLLISTLNELNTRSLSISKFLEKQMLTIIKNELNNNLNLANRGGVIGIIPSIEGYLNLLTNNNSRSPWAILYYAVRCGEIEEALRYVTDMNPQFDQYIVTALQRKVMGIPISGDLKNKLTTYFKNEIISPKCDPFKAITLSVLCGVGGYSNESIIVSFEDFLWFRLQLNVSFSCIVKDINGVTFDDANNPFMHGQVLILTDRLDEAAQWFLSNKEYDEDCFHIALALHSEGLINSNVISGSILEKSLFYSKIEPSLSIRYISMINNREERLRIMANLIVDSTDGISFFLPDEEGASPASQVLSPEDHKRAIETSAEESLHRGMYERAISLYKLSGNYENCALVISQQLKRYMDSSLGVWIIDVANQFLDQISNYPISIDSLLLLKQLVSIANSSFLIQKCNYIDGISEIEKADIFPTNSSQFDEYKKRIQRSHPLLKSVIPYALVNSAKAISEIIKLFPQNDSGKKQMKERANVIINFSSVLDIDMHEEMQRKLLNLHKLLN